MPIMLGNLKNNALFTGEALKKFEDFCKKEGIQRIDDCEKSSKIKGGYHIFDFPQEIACADKHTAERIRWFCENVEIPMGSWRLSYAHEEVEDLELERE